ncbi:MAG TPA: 50S ribosomal protein L15 [Deinococcales bacterium]|nr:50S ribosomal protein L15 [Deinococcales bacterium]
MKLNDLKPSPGSKTVRRRAGRGYGSGRGKTSGRGHKGQRSRSGFSQPPGWEGGRSALIFRLPKRGFSRASLQVRYQIVNLVDLNVLAADSAVNSITLYEHGLIRHIDRPVKLLGRGELEVSGLSIEVDRISRSAAAAVTAKGGRVVSPAPEEDAADAESGDEEAGSAEQA